AEEPIVETRVVPDEPVEEAQEPAVAPDVSEETTPDEELAPAVTPPSFDTVRIKPDGSAVIAGRAPPGSEVTVKSEDVNLGSETANRSGEWTLVPYIRIPPGDHQFSAVATLPDGTQVESDEVLIVSIPEPDEDQGSVLALLAPRDGEGGSTILQKPEPVQEQAEPEPAPEVEEEPSIEVARADEAPADEAGPGEEEPDEARPEEEPMDLASRDPAGSDEAGSGEAAAPDETMTDTAPTDDARLEEDGSDESGADAASESAGDAPAAPSEDEDQGPLAVDAVDYDDKGDITITGKSEPEADLHVYLDERHVGTVESDAAGEWELDPDETVEPGSYTLRVDQIDPAGVVLARIETPLVRARPELLTLGDAIVVVQPGNSLWRIARRTLGGGIHYTEIYEANNSQIKDPALIYPGQIFTVPGLD
ncbi:MAG: Ig-like domain-containing protein, partial [Rhodospirillaceae bacterium]|nr:Ig-like domain-containing protein [Rhodospirillaceae bacterium]